MIETKEPPAAQYQQYNDKVLDVPCMIVECGKARRKFVDAKWIYLQSSEYSYEDSRFYEEFGNWLAELMTVFKPKAGNDYITWRELPMPDDLFIREIAFRFDLAIDIVGFFMADHKKVQPEDACKRLFDVLMDCKAIDWSSEEEGQLLVKVAS